MPSKKSIPQTSQTDLLKELSSGTEKAPNFLELLKNPVGTGNLPQDFKPAEEAGHLEDLWRNVPKLRHYKYVRFVFAGGSGLVFQVQEKENGTTWAMKVGRAKLFRPPNSASGEKPAPPFSDAEISALEQISHPNIVALHERISDTRGVIALVTTYVEDPKQLDEYLLFILAQNPDRSGRKGIQPFSPQRLENACVFLIERFREIASALAYMHEKRMFHCDVKPGNILIGKDKRAILTDLGSCITIPSKGIDKIDPIRVRFTWTYAHPELRNLYQGDVKSISGGGLKVSAKVERAEVMPRFDLFAYGRTVQEVLSVLALDFGERSFASYGFRFLHIIACLLLDGHNAPTNERVWGADGKKFVSDIALNYPPSLFSAHRISTAESLQDRLERADREYSWFGDVPELDPWHPEAVNTGCGRLTPYTERAAAVFNHPALARLKSELQLGWVREVYPGATHTRWSHSLGVLANVADYYNALMADPELPTARILLNKTDIEHGLVAAILHDVGQTAFGHDLEVVDGAIFDHEALIPRLLNEKRFRVPTLRETIERAWKVDVDRVLSILGIGSNGTRASVSCPIDGLARDMISGPIDADKLDYLVRDSVYCGVPYGSGIDRNRFLKALTVEAKALSSNTSILSLAYRAKGAAAIESLLLARYQLYGAVYWHHTFRCVQAMFVHAAANAFQRQKLATENSKRRLKDEFYEEVICGGRFALERTDGQHLDTQPSSEVRAEPTLFFVWKHSDAKGKELIERVASRTLYKRVYEVRTGEMPPDTEYSFLEQLFAPERRLEICRSLQQFFLDAVNKETQRRGAAETSSENAARNLLQELVTQSDQLVVIDFPIRGVPDDKNIPPEIGDAARKYISGKSGEPQKGRSVFRNVRKLQVEITTFRIFAEPRLHQLIIRYLDPENVEACVFAALPKLKYHN